MSNATNVTIEVRSTSNGFVGIVRSAKTRREMFSTAPKTDANTAHLFALSAVIDRKWNEVAR